MKQQKDYHFLQQQVLLVIFLSVFPGITYVIFGYMNEVILPAALWYGTVLISSFFGFDLYRKFKYQKMDDETLAQWHGQVATFMYVIFTLWTVIFLFYVQEVESHLNYIAIFTQLGASIVASALLVSERKIFIPILFVLMVPLIVYFFLIGDWYGYVLSLFSVIFLGVLFYSSNNTYTLIQKNYYHAQHDELTGLCNRRHYLEFMNATIQRISENNKVAYMLLIDLDHFKTINDSLGHDIGDEVLKEVAKRIDSFSKESQLVARLGGDEFIVVSKEMRQEPMTFDVIYQFSNRLLVLLKKPYFIGHHHLYLSASIGISKIDDSFDNPNHFLKEADLAMYEAKSEGRDGIVIFDKSLSDKVQRNLLIEQNLYSALKERKITVYYQPLFNIEEKMIGCEALVRWHDKKLGQVSPNEFIPIAENTGLILELGTYILRETFKTLYFWHNKGAYLEHFAINISLRQLLSEPFIREVEVLYSYYFNKFSKKPYIVFEITEHVFSHDIDKVIDAMNRIKSSGISFSIDDFGTGYSSLNYLQKLPVDEIKIDRSFISGVGKKGTSENMVITILSIAENFSFRTVAEGVETHEQLMALKSYKCDMLQGWFFDKALSQSEFEKKYLAI